MGRNFVLNSTNYLWVIEVQQLFFPMKIIYVAFIFLLQGIAKEIKYMGRGYKKIQLNDIKTFSFITGLFQHYSIDRK